MHVVINVGDRFAEWCNNNLFLENGGEDGNKNRKATISLQRGSASSFFFSPLTQIWWKKSFVYKGDSGKTAECVFFFFWV